MFIPVWWVIFNFLSVFFHIIYIFSGVHIVSLLPKTEIIKNKKYCSDFPSFTLWFNKYLLSTSEYSRFISISPIYSLKNFLCAMWVNVEVKYLLNLSLSFKNLRIRKKIRIIVVSGGGWDGDWLGRGIKECVRVMVMF